MNSEEGARVSYTLRETTYPFLALIMLKGTHMTIIGRQEGMNSNGWNLAAVLIQASLPLRT